MPLDGTVLTELRIDDVRGAAAGRRAPRRPVRGDAALQRRPLQPARAGPDRRRLHASAGTDITTSAEHGLDEPVAVDGTTLSGGQRQRIGLARALGADPPVLVLHDPTTAVDAVTEQRIAGRAARRPARDRLPSVRRWSSPAARPCWLRADRVVYLATAGRGDRPHHDLCSDPAYRTAVLR